MPTKNLKIIDPFQITAEQCPVFVQTADTKGFFGWGIRKRTKSNWNHSCLMRLPGKIVTQGNTYKEIPIDRYMNRGQIIKFWVCKDITNEERNAIMLKVNHDLKKPWHKKMYDWPGIVGQFFGLRWFNIPGLNYCSERVAAKVAVILPQIQKHPTPEDIDTIFKRSERMKIIGFYMDT